MADTETTAAATEAKKAETVAENMDQRRFFETPELAAEYLNASADRFADFDSHPLVANGMDDEGNFDPAVYTDDMRVMVSVLKNREYTTDGKGERVAQPSTVKAIVVTPAPKLDAILADSQGAAWLNDIVEKELNHVAVRALRQAKDVSTVADQMPLTLAGYVTSQRAAGGIMETFDTLFKTIKALVSKLSPAFNKANLPKGEIKKAIESKAYATEYFSHLENRPKNDDGSDGSLFALAARIGEKLAARDGLNPAIFTKWLDNRDSIKLGDVTVEGSIDLDDLDLDAVDEKPATTTATDSTNAAAFEPVEGATDAAPLDTQPAE